MHPSGEAEQTTGYVGLQFGGEISAKDTDVGVVNGQQAPLPDCHADPVVGF